MLANWTAEYEQLERKAREAIGDRAMDEIFEAVSDAICENIRVGMQDYFDRRSVNSPTGKTNAEIGLWPELLQAMRRDVSWAAVGAVIGEHSLFTELLVYYREGRWPCAWDGKYPSGRFVLLKFARKDF